MYNVRLITNSRMKWYHEIKWWFTAPSNDIPNAVSLSVSNWSIFSIPNVSFRTGGSNGCKMRLLPGRTRDRPLLTNIIVNFHPQHFQTRQATGDHDSLKIIIVDSSKGQIGTLYLHSLVCLKTSQFRSANDFYSMIIAVVDHGGYYYMEECLDFLFFTFSCLLFHSIYLFSFFFSFFFLYLL